MSPNGGKKPPLLEEDLAYIRGRYQKRIEADGVTFKSMNSGTEEKQRVRHAVHASVIHPDSSVLDVGCGLGQFYENLRASGFRGLYQGVDIVPEYVDYCRERFSGDPRARFELANLFETGLNERHDVIVASQVFNARYPRSENLEAVRTFIREAFAHADQWVSVDMLTSHADFNVPELFYFSPEELFTYAKSLTRLVSLRHDYLPFEFTLQLGQRDALGGAWEIKR